MRFLLPDSIAGRTMIVLFVGLTLSHIASTAVLSNDRHDAVVKASERFSAERVAVSANLLDRTPAEHRAQLSHGFSSSSLQVSWGQTPTVAEGHEDEDHYFLREALRPFFGEVEHPRLHVVHRTVASGDEPRHGFLERIIAGFPEDSVMEMSFQLSDGSWANLDVAMARAAALWSPHSIISTLVMMAAIVVLGAWTTRWVGQPLATFAKAADRLSRDVNAPPLPEDGPREVKRAVVAFNEMQDRIRRFVEDRTRMLAAISHDLRSPITRIRLRTEMLPETAARDRILTDLAEMEAMVSSTLEFARGEAADEPTQIVDLAATLEAVCDNATDMGLLASYKWGGRLVCTCRPATLKRALANLIENAARYGGQATVRAAHRGADINVVIEDGGPGIPENEMEKVFTPFYRLERSRNRKTGGIGLGMTVARTIVRAHGGDIRLENRQEGGLRVIVHLPQAGLG